MRQISKTTAFIWVLFTSIYSHGQFVYKINIQADPLVKAVYGNATTGETNVRLKLYGDNSQTILVGKLMIGNFTAIIKKDQPDIGTISGIDIELTGSNWTNPIKLNNIIVKKESEDGSITKKYDFSCGCILTQSNSKVQIDEAGPVNFKEANIAAPDFTLDGQFSVNDVSLKQENVSIVVSKNRKGMSITRVAGQIPKKQSTPTQVCTEEIVNATSSFDINFIQNPNESNIFPGAMIYSEDIASGSYSSYASGSDLNPIRLTTNIAIIDGDPTIQVQDPDLGTINSAINNLLIRQQRGEGQLAATFEVQEINSMEELTLKLGAHFNSATFDANLSADLASKKEQHIKMIKFAQKYYTVTMVQPKKPTDLFKDKNKAIEALNSGKTPVYVNSVTFGRVCYFFMQSDESDEDFKGHIDAEYKGAATVGGKLDATAHRNKVTKTYSATIIGGSDDIAFTAIDGYDGFLAMIREAGRLHKASLALPISYSCKFLADNKQAFVNLASSYTKRTCVPVKSENQKAIVKLLRFHSISQFESTSEWVSLFEVKASNNPNIFVIRNDHGYYKNIKTVYMALKADETFDLDATGSFSFKIADLKNIQLFIAASVAERDGGIGEGLDGDDLFPKVEKALYLKDLIGTPQMPKENKFIVQIGSEKVEFVFTVTLEDE